MNANDVRNEIVRFLAQNAKRPAGAELGDDTNFVESGLLDSIGFVGLIAHLETSFGVELDLVEKPIENFIVVGSLIRQVTGA